MNNENDCRRMVTLWTVEFYFMFLRNTDSSVVRVERRMVFSCIVKCIAVIVFEMLSVNYI